MPKAESALRVIARPAFANREANPFNFLLYTELRARGVTVGEYNLQSWLFGRYDVFHIHWPESTFNASLVEAIATTQLLLRAMDHLRKRGTRMLWTAHNLKAHEARFPRAEAAFWRAFIARLDGVIALSETSLCQLQQRFPALARQPSFVIPHHHYRSLFPRRSTRAEAREGLDLPADSRVVLFFGRLREYKNVPALIRCFRELPQLPKTLLLIAGQPHDRATESEVREASGGDPRIRLDLAFVPSAKTELYFSAADLVALPFREMLNSGSALLSLSLDRSVLIPAQAAAAELQRSVGAEWLQLYEELTPQALLAALERAVKLPSSSDGRHLTELDPQRAAALTHDAYRVLVDAGRV